MARTKTKKPRGRGPGRPFMPGHSGNPGGRPKGHAEFRLAAREFTEEGLQILAGIMRGRKAQPGASARVRAIRELFDRGWGRPVQELQVQGAMANINTDMPLDMEDPIRQAQRTAQYLAFLLHRHEGGGRGEDAR